MVSKYISESLEVEYQPEWNSYIPLKADTAYLSSKTKTAVYKVTFTPFYTKTNEGLLVLNKLHKKYDTNVLVTAFWIDPENKDNAELQTQDSSEIILHAKAKQCDITTAGRYTFMFQKTQSSLLVGEENDLNWETFHVIYLYIVQPRLDSFVFNESRISLAPIITEGIQNQKVRWVQRRYPSKDSADAALNGLNILVLVFLNEFTDKKREEVVPFIRTMSSEKAMTICLALIGLYPAPNNQYRQSALGMPNPDYQAIEKISSHALEPEKMKHHYIFDSWNAVKQHLSFFGVSAEDYLTLYIEMAYVFKPVNKSAKFEIEILTTPLEYEDMPIFGKYPDEHILYIPDIKQIDAGQYFFQVSDGNDRGYETWRTLGVYNISVTSKVKLDEVNHGDDYSLDLSGFFDQSSFLFSSILSWIRLDMREYFNEDDILIEDALTLFNAQYDTYQGKCPANRSSLMRRLSGIGSKINTVVVPKVTTSDRGLYYAMLQTEYYRDNDTWDVSMFDKNAVTTTASYSDALPFIVFITLTTLWKLGTLPSGERLGLSDDELATKVTDTISKYESRRKVFKDLIAAVTNAVNQVIDLENEKELKQRMLVLTDISSEETEKQLESDSYIPENLSFSTKEYSFFKGVSVEALQDGLLLDDSTLYDLISDGNPGAMFRVVSKLNEMSPDFLDEKEEEILKKLWFVSVEISQSGPNRTSKHPTVLNEFYEDIYLISFEINQVKEKKEPSDALINMMYNEDWKQVIQINNLIVDPVISDVKVLQNTMIVMNGASQVPIDPVNKTYEWDLPRYPGHFFIDPSYFAELFENASYVTSTILDIEKTDFTGLLKSVPGAIKAMVRTPDESGIYRLNVESWTSSAKSFSKHYLEFNVSMTYDTDQLLKRLSSSINLYLEDPDGYDAANMFTRMIYAESFISDWDRMRAGTTAAFAALIKGAHDRNQTLFLVHCGLMAVCQEYFCYRGSQTVMKDMEAALEKNLKRFEWKDADLQPWKSMRENAKIPRLPYYLLAMVMHIPVKLTEEENQLLELIMGSLTDVATKRYKFLENLINTDPNDMINRIRSNRDGRILFLNMMEYDNETGPNTREDVNFDEIIQELEPVVAKQKDNTSLKSYVKTKPFADVLDFIESLEDLPSRYSEALDQMNTKRLGILPGLLNKQGFQTPLSDDNSKVADNITISGIRSRFIPVYGEVTDDMRNFFVVNVPPPPVNPAKLLLNRSVMKLSDMPSGILNPEEKGILSNFPSFDADVTKAYFQNMISKRQEAADEIEEDDPVKPFAKYVGYMKQVQDVFSNPILSTEDKRELMPELDDDDVDLILGNNIDAFSNKVASDIANKLVPEDYDSLLSGLDALFSIPAKFNETVADSKLRENLLDQIDELFSQRIDSQAEKKIVPPGSYVPETAAAVINDIIVPLNNAIDEKTGDDELKDILLDLLESKALDTWKKAYGQDFPEVPDIDSLASMALSAQAQSKAFKTMQESVPVSTDVAKRINEVLKGEDDQLPSSAFPEIPKTKEQIAKEEKLKQDVENNPHPYDDVFVDPVMDPIFSKALDIISNGMEVPHDTKNAVKGVKDLYNEKIAGKPVEKAGPEYKLVNDFISENKSPLGKLKQPDIIKTIIRNTPGTALHEITKFMETDPSDEKAVDEAKDAQDRIERAISESGCPNGKCDMASMENVREALSNITNNLQISDNITGALRKQPYYLKYLENYKKLNGTYRRANALFNKIAKRDGQEDKSSEAFKIMKKTAYLSMDQTEEIDNLVNRINQLETDFSRQDIISSLINDNVSSISDDISNDPVEWQPKKSSLVSTEVKSPQSILSKSELLSTINDRKCPIQFPLPLLMSSSFYQFISSTCPVDQEGDCITVDRLIRTLALSQIWRRTFSKTEGWNDFKDFHNTWLLYNNNKKSMDAVANNLSKRLYAVYQNYISPFSGVVDVPLFMQALFGSDMISFSNDSLSKLSDRMGWYSVNYRAIFESENLKDFVEMILNRINRIAVFIPRHPVYPWASLVKVGNGASGEQNVWMFSTFSLVEEMNSEKAMEFVVSEMTGNGMELLLDLGNNSTNEYLPSGIANKYEKREQVLVDLNNKAMLEMKKTLANVGRSKNNEEGESQQDSTAMDTHEDIAIAVTKILKKGN